MRRVEELEEEREAGTADLIERKVFPRTLSDDRAQ